MERALISFLSEKLGAISKVDRVGGGDISTAYRVETATRRFFVKTHTDSGALKMFEVEKLGLKEIAGTQTIKTPEVYDCGQIDSTAFIVLEYIPARPARQTDFQRLGTQLALLHQHRQDTNGWISDNFIGSLPQLNPNTSVWSEFYARYRLEFQIALARDHRLLDPSECPPLDRIRKVCQDCLPSGYPSLLHGDLWGGNFLIDTDGVPCLIDPAVYYGHHQVDLAMTQLFGGFSPAFYDAYYDQMQCPVITRAESDLYQLYYLLVHLNLFGLSYYVRVRPILDHYF